MYRYNKLAQYRELSIAQFAHRYMCMMENCTPADALNMIVFFKDIMADASDYKWEHVRGIHAIIVNMMETDRLSCSDKEQILNLRCQHVWGKGPMNSLTPKHLDHTKYKVMPALYLIGDCPHTEHHGDISHVCAYCLGQVERDYPHPEIRYRCKWWDVEKTQQAGGLSLMLMVSSITKVNPTDMTHALPDKGHSPLPHSAKDPVALPLHPNSAPSTPCLALLPHHHSFHQTH